MNKIKKVAVSTKKFVVAHKGAIAFAATVTALIAVNRQALNERDNFLKERGLYLEFLNPQG